MPELPDVDVYVERLSATIGGQRLERALPIHRELGADDPRRKQPRQVLCAHASPSRMARSRSGPRSVGFSLTLVCSPRSSIK